MIQIDAVWLAVQPVDLRSGAERLLAQVVQVFDAACSHIHDLRNRAETWRDGRTGRTPTGDARCRQLHQKKKGRAALPELAFVPELYRIRKAEKHQLARRKALTYVQSQRLLDQLRISDHRDRLFRHRDR